jgi:hypothetical protein
MKKHGFFSLEFIIGIFGINAVTDMFAFAAKLQLVALPPVLKFWVFWIGAIILALGVAWATYIFAGHKKVKLSYVIGVVAIGFFTMIFASQYVSLFFPVDPVALSMGGDSLEAGGLGWEWLIAPVLLAVVAYGVYGIVRVVRKKK